MENEVQIGQLIAGKYRIEQTLGRGGMGVVVAALHEQLNQRVALKFLTDNAYQQAEAVGRFVREARAAVQIQSEHVARVMDVGTLESGAPYMVMEYLRGRDLKEVSSRRGPLPITEAVDYVLQACDAVAEAHSLGIVHRDLKPSNLFLTERPDGSPLVKVLDFGISKALHPGDRNSQLQLTASAAIMGSPQYMSPEQIRSSKTVDARADVWALGTILHELLTGTPAYVADTVPGLLAMIVADAPPPLSAARRDAPPELEAIILRCLEKDRERRYPSVSALARALECFASFETKPIVRRIARVLGDVAPPPTEVVEASSGAVRAQEPAAQTNNPWSRTGHLRLGGARPFYARRGVQLAAGAGVLGLGALLWLLVRSGSPPVQAGALRIDTRVTAAAPSPVAPRVSPIAATAEGPSGALPGGTARQTGSIAPGSGLAAKDVAEARIRPIVQPAAASAGAGSTAAGLTAAGSTAAGSTAAGSTAAKGGATSTSSDASSSARPSKRAAAPAKAAPRPAPAPRGPRTARPAPEAPASAAPASGASSAPAKKADTLQDLFNDTK